MMKTDRVPVLVDTNIWSEAVKAKADPGVISWLQENEPLLYISTLTIGFGWCQAFLALTAHRS